MTLEDQFILFHSRAGRLIRVRPLRFDDAPLLVDVFHHMTAESRYRRFHQSLEHVSATRIQLEAVNIAQADPSCNWGLIAFVDMPGKQNVPIGVVRMVQTELNEAEVAISIRDDFQNVGIGTQLMRLLAEKAIQIGLRRLVAVIQNNNAAIWHVFNSLPYQVTRLPEGSYSNIVISLTSPRDALPSPPDGTRSSLRE